MSAPLPPPAHPRRKFSLWKRIGFNALLFLMVVAGVEGISWLALTLRFGGWSESARELDAALRSDVHGSIYEAPEDVLHPYLGWVRRPPGEGEDGHGRIN